MSARCRGLGGKPRVATLGVLVASALAFAGCISLDKRDMDAARERLDACIAEHGREHPECREAELALRDAQERYEGKAREAWVCDPTQDPCPTPR